MTKQRQASNIISVLRTIAVLYSILINTRQVGHYESNFNLPSTVKVCILYITLKHKMFCFKRHLTIIDQRKVEQDLNRRKIMELFKLNSVKV